MTHSDLIRFAAKWLKKHHSIVITEMSSGAGEEADAIGIHGSLSTLIECKASRADFKRDALKYYRRSEELGMGSYRYLLTPKGLIKEDELYEKWGLLEINDNLKLRMKVKAKPMNKSQASEMWLLASTLRRIGQNAPQGVSVKCYTYTTQNRATLGIKEY